MQEFFTPKQFAEILDVPPARVRQWQARGLITSVHARGPVEYHRRDLVRMAILVALETITEQPIKFVDSHLEGAHSMIAQLDGAGLGSITLRAPAVDVELKPAIIAALRERIAQVRS